MYIFWILTLALATGQLIRLPLSGGGVIALDIVVFILCSIGLIKLKFKLKKPPLFIISGIAFIFIAAVSLLLTPLHLLPNEVLTSFLYTVRFSAYMLLGWIIFSNAFPTLQDKIPQVFILSGVCLTALGLIQLVFLPDLRFLQNWGWDPHYFRTVSTFFDPNFAGAFFVLTLILLLHLRCMRIPPLGWVRLTPWFFYVIFAIVYLALLTTFSRGAYLAFLASFLTISFLQKSFKLGSLSILLFMGLLLGFFAYQKAVAEPRGIDRTESAEFRLNTWQQGGILFQTHPILGIGFNAYRYALRQYHLGSGEFLKSHGASTNDSSLLYVAATTGIIGLTGFLFFLLALIRSRNLILTAGLIGLITQSFFANTLFYPFILIWIILISTIPKK